MDGLLIAFGAFLAVASLVFFLNKGIQPASGGCWSAIAMLSFAIAFFLMIASVCFFFFSKYGWSWPFALFVVFFALYLVAEIYFLLYFYLFHPNNFIDKLNHFLQELGVNPLKGWGGETFSDFYNGMGVLVAVGVNLVFSNLSGEFWWAGQLAGLISIMSAAAWVQRFTREGPEKPPDNILGNPGQEVAFRAVVHSYWQYFYKTFPKLLVVFAAILTGLSVIVPTESNISSMQAAVQGNKGIVVGMILMWLFVFVAWALVTAMVVTRVPWKWPREAVTWEPNRGKEGPVFLLPTLIGVMIGVVFVAIFISPTVNFKAWPDTWGTVFGIATAILFVAAEFFNVKDPLVEWFANRQLSMEQYIQLEKDAWLLLGGVVIFVVQCAIAARGRDQVLQDQGWLIVYILSLVLMGFGALRGLARGAIRMIPKWRARAQAQVAVHPQVEQH